MELKTFYIFTANLTPYRCGNYDVGDDWYEIAYADTIDDVVNKAAKLCGSRDFITKDMSFNLYECECYEHNGQLYGKLILPDYVNSDPEPMYHFDINESFPSHISTRNCFPSSSISNETKDRFIQRILSSNIYKDELAKHKERVRIYEEERHRKYEEEREEKDRETFEELKKKFNAKVN
jgi:hypothetical protein